MTITFYLILVMAPIFSPCILGECLCCLYKPFPSHLNYFKLRLFIHTLSFYALCAAYPCACHSLNLCFPCHWQTKLLLQSRPTNTTVKKQIMGNSLSGQKHPQSIWTWERWETLLKMPLVCSMWMTVEWLVMMAGRRDSSTKSQIFHNNSTCCIRLIMCVCDRERDREKIWEAGQAISVTAPIWPGHEERWGEKES